jgi:hypothetical protein
MSVLLDLLFWGVLSAYVVHIVDEALLGGGFVAKVQEHWWPEYRTDMFFWFNTGYLICMTASILLYERWGGAWVILPLYFTFERALHGITVHLWWTIRYREYSPGLVTCILFAQLLYFVTRFGLIPRLFSPTEYVIGGILGAMAAVFLGFLPTTIMPRMMRARNGRSQRAG